jgi:hypothetical protein
MTAMRTMVEIDLAEATQEVTVHLWLLPSSSTCRDPALPEVVSSLAMFSGSGSYTHG